MVDLNKFYNDFEEFMNERFKSDWHFQSDHEGFGLILNITIESENFEDEKEEL